jgi:hypothetical protein
MALGLGAVGRGFGATVTGPSAPTAPDVPTVTATNNGDGTATVTISDSTSGTTNTVYTVPIDSQWNDPLTWTSRGSRSNDGTVNISPGAGIYWLKVRSTQGDGSAESEPQYLHVTNGTTAVLSQIIDAVVARIRLLNLDGIQPGNVYDHTILDPSKSRAIRDNAVLVAPVDQEQIANTGPTNADDIVYPVVVGLVAPANRSQTDANRNKWFLWRERVRKAFINQGLVVADGNVWQAEIQPLRIVVREWWERNAFVSPMIIRFTSREERGIT